MSSPVGSVLMEQQYYPSSSDAHLISDGIELQKMMELLQRQNQQLLREKQTMESQLELFFGCCTELGFIDRIQEHMARKAFQRTAMYPPSTQPKIDSVPSTDSFICGSPRFHEFAAAASSYEAQLARKSYHRRNILKEEEAQLTERFDIFGNPRNATSRNTLNACKYTQDAMDQFLTRGVSHWSAFRLP